MIAKSLRLICLRNRGKKKGQEILLEIYISIKGKKLLSTKAINVWAMLSLNGHICFDRTQFFEQNISCMLVFSTDILTVYVTGNNEK